MGSGGGGGKQWSFARVQGGRRTHSVGTDGCKGEGYTGPTRGWGPAARTQTRSGGGRTPVLPDRGANSLVPSKFTSAGGSGTLVPGRRGRWAEQGALWGGGRGRMRGPSKGKLKESPQQTPMDVFAGHSPRAGSSRCSGGRDGSMETIAWVGRGVHRASKARGLFAKGAPRSVSRRDWTPRPRGSSRGWFGDLKRSAWTGAGYPREELGKGAAGPAASFVVWDNRVRAGHTHSGPGPERPAVARQPSGVHHPAGDRAGVLFSGVFFLGPFGVRKCSWARRTTWGQRRAS